MTEVTKQDTSTTREVLYLGACTLSTKKPGARWILRDALDKIDPKELSAAEIAFRVASAYSASTAKGRDIGSIYSVECEVDGDKIMSMRFGTMRWVGQSDNPLVMGFKAADVNQRAANKLVAAERKAKENPLFMRGLDHTVAMLKQMPYRQRMATIDAIRNILIDRSMTR